MVSLTSAPRRGRARRKSCSRQAHPFFEALESRALLSLSSLPVDPHALAAMTPPAAMAPPGSLPTVSMQISPGPYKLGQSVTFTMTATQLGLAILPMSYTIQQNQGTNAHPNWVTVSAVSKSSTIVVTPTQGGNLQFRGVAVIAVDTDAANENATKEKDSFDDLVDLSQSPESPYKLAADAPYADDDEELSFPTQPVFFLEEAPITGTIMSVSFQGKGNTIVTPDPVKNPDNGGRPYTTPDWLDNNLDGTIDPKKGEREFPTSYERGSTPTFSATVVLNAAPPKGTTIMIRGTGPDKIDVPATAAALNGTKATITNVKATSAFPNKVDYYSSFRIRWEISTDGGTTWQAAGRSDNEIFVTLAAPQTSLRYVTLFFIGSLEAIGDTTAADTISDVWDAFAPNKIQRTDGTPLVYYGTYGTGVTSTTGLLKGANGQCGSFCKLFIDVLKEQGIKRNNDYVTVFYANGVANGGFLVKNWNFAAAGTSGNPFYPYVNVLKQVDKNGYSWTKAEATQAPGIPGQNNPSPASMFNNHQVVLLGDVLYDPSYGVTYLPVAGKKYKSRAAELKDMLADMENKSIEAYYLRAGNTLIIKKNAGNGELIGKTSTY